MTNKSYNNIDDFLKDSSFKNWALNSKLSDVSFWEYWLSNNTDKKELAEEAKTIIIGVKFKENIISEEKISLAWSNFESEILEKQKLKQKIHKNINNKDLCIGIVASIILLIGSYFYILDDKTTSYNSGFGEILHIKLQDGSLVTLNSNSTISYKKENPRKIKLKGEAYFDVAKKETANAKFWVFTDDLKIEVYGTKFNVKSNEEKTQVFLEEGNIQLNLKNGNTKKMIPGDFISFSAEKQQILEKRTNVIATENTSWKTGKLTFNNVTLSEVFKKISETYGYEIIFKSMDIKNILLSGTIPTSNLTICLKAIEKSVNVTITKENTILVVSKR